MNAKMILYNAVIEVIEKVLAEHKISKMPHLLLISSETEAIDVLQFTDGVTFDDTIAINVFSCCMFHSEQYLLETLLHEVKHFIDNVRIDNFKEKYIEEMKKKGYFANIFEVSARQFAKEMLKKIVEKERVDLKLYVLGLTAIAEDTSEKDLQWMLDNECLPLTVKDFHIKEIMKYIEEGTVKLTRAERKAMKKAFRKYLLTIMHFWRTREIDDVDVEDAKEWYNDTVNAIFQLISKL